MKNNNDQVNSEEPIIVFTTDSNYTRITYIALNSVMNHTKENRTYHLKIIVPPSFDNKSKNLLMNIKRKFNNCTLEILVTEDNFFNVFVPSHLTKMTYYRLLIPYLIKEDKCLYIDPDIIAENDVEEIYKLDISNYLVAGVKSPRYHNLSLELQQYYKSIGLEKTNQYINAGVLLLNLKRIREEGIASKMIELCNLKLNSCDQDAINIACYNKIKFLSLKYNFMTTYANSTSKRCNNIFSEEELLDAQKNAVIIHYVTAQKPWNDLECNLAIKWWEACKEASMWNYFLMKKEYLFYYDFILNRDKITSKEQLVKEFFKWNKIVIYGCGKVGKKTLEFLKNYGFDPIGFAVTNKDSNPEYIDNIPVKEISEYENESADTLILIAILADAHSIIKPLMEKGFKRIVKVGNIIWEGENK